MNNQQIQREFFSCDIFDSFPYVKDDMASMEHPIFSLSTEPDKRILRYEHNENSIRIIPSTLGIPTIHDKDILIYCISYLRAAMNEGKTPNRTVRFTVYDFFKAINRDGGGRSYERFKDSLNRLKGVTIITSIKTGRYRIEKGFGLIDSWGVVEGDTSGRIIAVEIIISEWIYNSILSNELLTINQDYFQLRKPLERRLYELARKHCGNQETFKIGLEKLQLKAGSSSLIREFRRSIREVVADNHLPDYEIKLEVDDNVIFINRIKKHITAMKQSDTILLKPQTYDRIKTVAPGCDVHNLEQEWRSWISKKKELPKRPDAAFLAFCKKKQNQKVA